MALNKIFSTFKIYMHLLKVVSSESLGGYKIVLIVKHWPRSVALGIILNFQLAFRLDLNILPFPVSTAKSPGDFCNSRQSAAKWCPHFACSFVSIMLCQYYWSCNQYSANRQSPANKKNSAKFPYWRCEFVPLRL